MNASDSLWNNCLGEAFYHSLCLSYSSSCQGESLFFPYGTGNDQPIGDITSTRDRHLGCPPPGLWVPGKCWLPRVSLSAKPVGIPKLSLPDWLSPTQWRSITGWMEPCFWSRLLRSQILMKFHFPSHAKIARGLGLFLLFFSYTFNNGK